MTFTNNFVALALGVDPHVFLLCNQLPAKLRKKSTYSTVGSLSILLGTAGNFTSQSSANDVLARHLTLLHQ